jgi:hypothetical protein
MPLSYRILKLSRREEYNIAMTNQEYELTLVKDVQELPASVLAAFYRDYATVVVKNGAGYIRLNHSEAGNLLSRQNLTIRVSEQIRIPDAKQSELAAIWGALISLGREAAERATEESTEGSRSDRRGESYGDEDSI